jgi:hypothetical protein
LDSLAGVICNVSSLPGPSRNPSARLFRWLPAALDSPVSLLATPKPLREFGKVLEVVRRSIGEELLVSPFRTTSTEAVGLAVMVAHASLALSTPFAMMNDAI